MPLTHLGCHGLEIDAVERVIHPGERVETFDVKGVTISGWVYSRHQLRELAKPAWAATAPTWNEARWRAQFPAAEQPLPFNPMSGPEPRT